MPIRIKVDVTKLDKSAFYRAESGAVYADLVAWETPDGKYDNDWKVVQDLPRERREAGDKGAIVGNGKNFGNAKRQAPSERQAPPAGKQADPDLDADSSVPF